MSDAEIIQAQAREIASLRAALEERKQLGDVLVRRLIRPMEPRVRLESWRVQCNGCGETWAEGNPQRHNEACPVLAWQTLAAAPAAATPAAEPQGVGE